MDAAMVPMMIFTVVVLMLIGGFILLLPLARRLGALVEHRMLSESEAAAGADVEALARAVETLREEVERLAERQEFTEKLLDRPRTPGS